MKPPAETVGPNCKMTDRSKTQSSSTTATKHRFSRSLRFRDDTKVVADAKSTEACGLHTTVHTISPARRLARGDRDVQPKQDAALILPQQQGTSETSIEDTCAKDKLIAWRPSDSTGMLSLTRQRIRLGSKAASTRSDRACRKRRTLRPMKRQ
jgi:hypothetical protein